MAHDSNGRLGDGPANCASWLVALQPELRRMAWSLTGNATDAADLLQATNVRALEKRALFVSGGANEFRRWLSRIMGNLRRDSWRRESRLTPAGWLERIPAPDAAPPERWVAFDHEDVLSAMTSLQPRLREAYRMFAVERVSYAVISNRLKISRGTVATRIHRARATLRAKLDPRKPVAA